MCSEYPAWKRLTNHVLSTHERVSLLASIFTDRNEVEVAEHIFGDDAQIFVDVVDEVSIFTLLPGFLPLKLTRLIG